MFKSMQEKTPFLEGSTRDKRAGHEDASIMVAVYVTVFQGELKGRPVRGDSHYGMPTWFLGSVIGLWATMAGLSQWQGPRGRKHPVTPLMLIF